MFEPINTCFFVSTSIQRVSCLFMEHPEIQKTTLARCDVASTNALEESER